MSSTYQRKAVGEDSYVNINVIVDVVHKGVRLLLIFSVDHRIEIKSSDTHELAL